MGTGGRNKTAEYIYDYVELLNQALHCRASEVGGDESKLPTLKRITADTYEAVFKGTTLVLSFKEKK